MMDPLNMNLNSLLAAVVKDSLTEYTYPASLAGLNYSIQDTVYGLEVSSSAWVPVSGRPYAHLPTTNESCMFVFCLVCSARI